MTPMTRSPECTASTSTLFVAFELGSTQWKLAFAAARAARPWLRTVPAGNLERVWQEVTAAKRRFGLEDTTAVRSCYEAGRDGFWLHRALTAHGLINVVTDPSSIAVDRRQRRAKTDRLDASKLVVQLMNAAAGDRRGWREVHVPSIAVEADRQLQREWETVREDRKRIRNRLQGVLATQGIHVPLTTAFPLRLVAVRTGDGQALPAGFMDRLNREWTHLRQVEARLTTLRHARRARVEAPSDTVARQTRQLTQLCGVAANGALTLTTELFAWRGFTNGRQIGAVAGLTPTPYRSDQTAREQGISRSGNRRVRALSIQLAWGWLRHQRTSALTQWFEQRFGHHRRARRIGIVALARTLLIALWRYVDQGVVPDGARLKV